MCAAGSYSSSFRAEAAALRLCLRDLLEDGRISVPHGAEIRICTDSRSAVEALQKGPCAQTGRLEEQVWELLNAVTARHGAHVTLQWVPGHVDLAEQEQSDEVAKRAARECAQDAAPVSYGVAKAVVDASLRARWYATTTDRPYVGIPATHVWRRATGGKTPKHGGDTPRAEQRLLAQLRAGKSPVLDSYAHHLGNIPAPQCRDCGGPPDAPKGDVEHMLLHCPAHHPARQRHLGPDATLGVLSTRPDAVVRYLRAAGRAGVAGEQYAAAARKFWPGADSGQNGRDQNHS